MPLCTQKTRLFKSTENILMPSAFAWVLTQIFLLKAIKSYFTQNMTKEVKLIHLFFPQDFTYPCPICNWNWHWMRVFFHIYDKCWKPIGGILNKIRQDQKELKRVKWKQQVVKAFNQLIKDLIIWVSVWLKDFFHIYDECWIPIGGLWLHSIVH